MSPGRSRTRSRVSMPCPFNAGWGCAVIRPRGRGCTSFAGRWYDPIAIDWPARWRWMKPTWAGRKPACTAGRRRPRALSSWLWNYAGIADLGASGCDTFPMSRAKSLVGFVTEVVARGSVVKTDGWPGYRGLTKHNDAHHVTAISSTGDPAVVVMPSGSSRGRAAQTLAAGHLPRGRPPRAPRLLLGRVHLSLHSPDLAGPGPPLLPAAGTGRSDRPHPNA